MLKQADVDLPLINTDGDKGERGDDEDGFEHINHGPAVENAEGTGITLGFTG